MKKAIQKIKGHFVEVVKTKRSPESIALGFSVGTFIAVLPTPGLSLLIGLVIVLVFSRISKYALFSAFLVWNPLVLVPLHMLSYRMGLFLLGSAHTEAYGITFLSHAYSFTARFLLGNLIIASALSCLAYFLVISAARAYQGKAHTEK